MNVGRRALRMYVISAVEIHHKAIQLSRAQRVGNLVIPGHYQGSSASIAQK